MSWLRYEGLIAAIDGSVVIYAIIIVIWFLSWIVKAIKGNSAAGKPVGSPRRLARPRNKRLSEEIDVFLREVGGAQPARRRPPPPPEEVPIEIVADAERRPPQRPSKPGEAIARRKSPGSKNLGAGVRRHIKQQGAADRIGQEVARDLSHDVSSSVASHLGKFRAGLSADAQQVSASSRTAREIMRMLRDREGLRQAVLLSEILPRTKGLRRKP